MNFLCFSLFLSLLLASSIAAPLADESLAGIQNMDAFDSFEALDTEENADEFQDLADMEAMNAQLALEEDEEADEEEEADENNKSKGKGKQEESKGKGKGKAKQIPYSPCSQEGLRQPAAQINSLCETSSDPNIKKTGLCSDPCATAVCNVIGIFRQCRAEVQQTVDKLVESMNKEIQKHCKHSLGCLSSKSSAGVVVTPSWMLIFTLTVVFMTLVWM